MSDRVVITERMPDGMPQWVDDAMAAGTLFSEIKARYLMEDQREAVATWMIKQGYATGHGDTIEEMLEELREQLLEEQRKKDASMVAMKLMRMKLPITAKQHNAIAFACLEDER